MKGCNLRILKTLLTDYNSASDFAQHYDESLFSEEYRPFARTIISHCRAYKSIPTERILLENAGLMRDEFEGTLNELKSVDAPIAEFKYELDKLKNQFTQNNLKAIERAWESNLSIEDKCKFAEAKLAEIKTIKKGVKGAFVQKSLKSYMPEFKEEFKAKVNNPNVGRGILTGYSFLDYIKNGMGPAEMMIIAAETGAGKEIILSTNILTVSGFKKMKDIHPGEKVFGRDGKLCKVIAESIPEKVKGWKLTFNDGTSIIAHDKHEWFTYTHRDMVQKTRFKNGETKENPIGSVKTTKEIVKTLKVGPSKRSNHCIPNCEPLQLPKKQYKLDPYILGAWLGDGSASSGVITSADPEIIEEFIKLGFTEYSQRINKNNKAIQYYFKSLVTILREIGVYKNKHIPQEYLLGNYDQRLALLQGLMDTDGYANKNGRVSFCNTNKKLIDAVVFLINSLGEKASVCEGWAKLDGVITGKKWEVYFSANFSAFRLPRKLARQKIAPKRLNAMRYIVSAKRTGKKEMKCIQVDSPDHLYLAGNQLVPTHNSMLLNNMAIQMWMQKNTIYTDPKDFVKGHNVLYFSLEMPHKACARRSISRIAEVPSYGIRDAKLTKDQAIRLGVADKFIQQYPWEFEIVDVPRGITVEEIERRYLDACARFTPEVVVVDYLGLIEDHDIQGDDWLKLGYIAGKLHEFGRVYNIPVLTAAQLNRAKKTTGEDSENIGVHRIGRSALIMHHADIAIQIESRPNENRLPDMKYHIIKHRDGELGNHLLSKNLRCSTLKDRDPPYVPELASEEMEVLNSDMENLSEQLKKIGWT